jgi:hypothetical protein
VPGKPGNESCARLKPRGMHKDKYSRPCGAGRGGHAFTDLVMLYDLSLRKGVRETLSIIGCKWVSVAYTQRFVE